MAFGRLIGAITCDFTVDTKETVSYKQAKSNYMINATKDCELYRIDLNSIFKHIISFKPELYDDKNEFQSYKFDKNKLLNDFMTCEKDKLEE